MRRKQTFQSAVLDEYTKYVIDLDEVRSRRYISQESTKRPLVDGSPLSTAKRQPQTKIPFGELRA